MKKIALPLCVFLFLSCKGFCQIFDTNSSALTMGTWLSNNTSNNITADNIRRDNARRDRENGIAGTTTSKSVEKRGFQFKPDSVLSIKIKEDIIGRLKKNNAQSGAVVETALNKTNLFQIYVSSLKSQYDLDVRHNLADALTAYMLGMWRIANLKDTDPSRQQIAGMREEVYLVIRNIPATDSAKQREAETMIYELIFSNEPYETSRKRHEQAQIMKDSDAVHNRFLRQNRLDLRKLILTDNGLVKK